MDVRDLERKLDYLEETKQSIKQSIEKAGTQVGDIPFREYSAKIEDATKEWVPPDYFPFDIVKILDEDEDSNRIIAEGGGSCILLYNWDINSKVLTQYGGNNFLGAKFYGEQFIQGISGYNNYDLQSLPKIKNDNGEWFYQIIYLNTSSPDLSYGRQFEISDSKVNWVYNKIYGLTILKCDSLKYVTYSKGSALNGSRFRSAYCENKKHFFASPIKPFDVAEFVRNMQYVEEILFDTEDEVYFHGATFSFESVRRLKVVHNIINVSLEYRLAYNGYQITWCPSMEQMLIKGVNKDWSGFANMPCLNKNSLIFIMEHAEDVTENPKVFTFGAINLAKLTDEEKKIATDKGWILQ